MPFVIGIAGSVAVGKSTISRVLKALLSHWPSHPQVDLITTDGFLLPQSVLEARGIMERKGFPESYDVRRLVRFLADVKSGVPEVQAPVYSHLRYDIVAGEYQTVRHPDVVIVEGLERAADGCQPGRPSDADVRVRLLRLRDLRGRAGDRHRAVVRRALPRVAGDGLQEPFVLFPPLRGADQRAGDRDRARASGGRSIWSTCARTCCPRASGRTSFWRRVAITRCVACGCERSEGPAKAGHDVYAMLARVGENCFASTGTTALAVSGSEKR